MSAEDVSRIEFARKLKLLDNTDWSEINIVYDNQRREQFAKCWDLPDTSSWGEINTIIENNRKK